MVGASHGPPEPPAHESARWRGRPEDGWVDSSALGEPRSGPEQPHVSRALARRLREAGLAWAPANGDRFVIPERSLDEHVFLVSPMSVEVRESPSGPLLTFNGAVEWALDAIVVGEAIWVPSEGQARDRLGAALVGLERHDDAWHCTIEVDGERPCFSAAEPADAYALALLHLLTEGRRR